MRVGEPFNPYRMFRGIFVPEALCRSSDLLPGAKLTYGRLVHYAGESGDCHPSVATLAKEIACSERQLRYHLSQLTDRGFIRRVHRSGKATRFEFLWHPVFEAEPLQQSAGDPCNALPQKRVKKTLPHRGQEWGPSFGEWWTIYPRKVSKPDGRRAYQKVIVNGSSKDDLAEDLRRFVDFAGRHKQLMTATSVYANGEFAARAADKIPYPATFINRGDWLSLPESPVQRDSIRMAWQ
jgi:hypothetical protein